MVSNEAVMGDDTDDMDEAGNKVPRRISLTQDGEHDGAQSLLTSSATNSTHAPDTDATTTTTTPGSAGSNIV